MEKAPQLLVTGGIVRGIDRLVVLAEELLMLLFGEISQDHQRIGGIFRGCAVTGLSLRLPAMRSLPAARAWTQTPQVRSGPSRLHLSSRFNLGPASCDG